MPNVEEQKQKTIEFSPIDTVEDTTSLKRSLKGRVSNEKNVIHIEVRNDGRNEIKRHSGGRTESRER